MKIAEEKTEEAVNAMKVFGTRGQEFTDLAHHPKTRKSEKIMKIAIDASAGAESTVAKAIAQKMNFNYLDTGAMQSAPLPMR